MGMVGQQGLDCFLANFPASTHGKHNLHSLKKPSKQRPSCADAVVLSPLIFPSQLSFILRFANSMQI